MYQNQQWYFSCDVPSHIAAVSLQYWCPYSWFDVRAVCFSCWQLYLEEFIERCQNYQITSEVCECRATGGGKSKGFHSFSLVLCTWTVLFHSPVTNIIDSTTASPVPPLPLTPPPPLSASPLPTPPPSFSPRNLHSRRILLYLHT